MERMGLNMNQINDVIEVTILSKEKEIKIKNPQVFEITAKGSRVFQITSDNVEEHPTKTKSMKEEDIALVMSQAGVDHETAEAALEEADGDIALAIMRLRS
jgi:nascent polypeptide-associated complex subunit alpha